MGRNVLNLWEKYYDATFPIKEGDGFIILGIDSFTASDAEAQLAQALEAVKPFHALTAALLFAQLRDFSFCDESATGFTNRLRILAFAGTLFRCFCLALLFRDRDLPGW